MGDVNRSQVLVTGGSGFIGRRLVRALLETGAADVALLKRLKASTRLSELAGILPAS